jgi:hypothetical protein
VRALWGLITLLGTGQIGHLVIHSTTVHTDLRVVPALLHGGIDLDASSTLAFEGREPVRAGFGGELAALWSAELAGNPYAFSTGHDDQQSSERVIEVTLIIISQHPMQDRRFESPVG